MVSLQKTMEFGHSCDADSEIESIDAGKALRVQPHSKRKLSKGSSVSTTGDHPLPGGEGEEMGEERQNHGEINNWRVGHELVKRRPGQADTSIERGGRLREGRSGSGGVEGYGELAGVVGWGLVQALAADGAPVTSRHSTNAAPPPPRTRAACLALGVTTSCCPVDRA